MRQNKIYDVRLALVRIWECSRSQISIGRDKNGNTTIAVEVSSENTKIGKSRKVLSQQFPGRRINSWESDRGLDLERLIAVS
jgi:hypothetical protein